MRRKERRLLKANGKNISLCEPLGGQEKLGDKAVTLSVVRQQSSACAESLSVR